jgi:uncharacterized protein YndB with AHSA1/START domain
MRGAMLTVDRVISAPPSAVWKVLVDLDAWPVWGPSISGARLDGPSRDLGPDSTGQVIAPLGVTLPFEITAFDEGRSWAWKVLGVNATRHRVEPVPGGSRLTFEVPLWAAPYLAVCGIALRRIERLTLDQHG